MSLRLLFVELNISFERSSIIIENTSIESYMGIKYVMCDDIWVQIIFYFIFAIISQM